MITGNPAEVAAVAFGTLWIKVVPGDGPPSPQFRLSLPPFQVPSMVRSLRLLIPLWIALTSHGFVASAADGKGPAFTEPPNDDPNFPLMGEFVGEVASGDGESKDKALVGLQIRPVGNDEFDAVSFLGGLPGQEGHQGEPVRMIGRRSDDFLILSGGPFAIIVEPDHCLLIDRKGNKAGKLERIQRTSPTLGAPPPKEALVLFDGTNVDHFINAQMTKEGLLMQGADIKPMFQDFNLHVEFRVPYMPQAGGQSRGNSGLYLQSRYECQILDSFALESLYNGLGALYRFKKPDLNMSFPPLVWQTYDVQFTAPRWAADGSKIRDAHITAWVNGVKVQDNVALPNKTGAGKQEEPLLLPIRIQDHGDPVRFRNIWLVDRGLALGEFPVYPTQEQLAAAAKAEEKKKAEKAKAEARAKAKAEKAKEKAKAEAQANEAKEKAAEQESKRPEQETKKAEQETDRGEQEPTKDEQGAAKESEKQEAASEGKVDDQPQAQSEGSDGAAAAPSGPIEEKYAKLGQRIIGKYDQDNDNALDASEWEKMLMSPADADDNRDGRVTVEEYALWMQSRDRK